MAEISGLPAPGSGAGSPDHLVHTTPAELLAAAYLAGYGVRTRRGYRTSLRRWLTWCDAHDLDPLTVRRHHIETWARTLEEIDGLAARTVASYLTPVIGMYAYAHREELLDRHPGLYVRRPTTPRVSSSGSLTADELAALLVASWDHHPSITAAVHIWALNGTRWAETRAIDIDHLGHHGDLTTIHLPHRKGGGIATISLSEPTVDAVAAARAGRTAGPLLVAPTGTSRRITRDALRAGLRQVLTDAGIERRITPHSLRHTFVTIALDAEVSTRDLMASTGHEDPSMLAYYDRARASIERNATHQVTAWILDPRRGGGDRQ